MPSDEITPWLPARLQQAGERQTVLLLFLGALLIRVYLALTNFCITSDGMEYVRMARDFAAGRTRHALTSVFSPLYPWLISLTHDLVANWETSGNLVSAAVGALAVALLYYLVEAVFERRDLATGAATLAAIHPAMAEYSASVMTDAGFVSLMLASLYLFVSAIKRRRTMRMVWAGAAGGAAYLYRAEAIGLLPVCAGFLLAGARLWRVWRPAAALRWALAFAAAFLLVASPYLLFLHQLTGHWVVSTELNVSASASVMEFVRDKAAWQALARSGNASLLAPLMLDPLVYIRKIGREMLLSPYYFIEAINPVVFVLLLIGWWARGRRLFRNWGEVLLALVAGFYFFGFMLFNTGPRFMTHLIPYTFGWVMVGLEHAGAAMARVRMPGGRRLAPGAAAIALAAILLPGTLLPIGYDIRGFRYAGGDLARSAERPRTIVACDRRVAFYAGAGFIALPAAPPDPDICGWLLRQPGANYLMLSQRDERRWTNLTSRPCLRFVKRYPRTGDRYYDLFRILRPG